MDWSDLVKILVPVFGSSIISVIITVINNRSLKKKNAKKAILQKRLLKLQNMLSEIKTTVINIECHLIDVENGLKSYYIASGNLQVYLEENKTAMAEEVNRYGDLYHMDRLNALLKKVTEVGLLMRADDMKGFATAFIEAKDLCDELLKSYNLNLSRIEYV